MESQNTTPAAGQFDLMALLQVGVEVVTAMLAGTIQPSHQDQAKAFVAAANDLAWAVEPGKVPQLRRMGPDGAYQQVGQQPVITHKLIQNKTGATWEIKADCCQSNEEAFRLTMEGHKLYEQQFSGAATASA